MESLDYMPTARTPEASQNTRHYRVLVFCLPYREIRSATPTTIDFGATCPVHLCSGLRPPCLRFAVCVATYHARLGTWLLARLYRGNHLRLLYFMRLQGTTLIKPDMQISRIRLSDKTSRLRPRHIAL